MGQINSKSKNPQKFSYFIRRNINDKNPPSIQLPYDEAGSSIGSLAVIPPNKSLPDHSSANFQWMDGRRFLALPESRVLFPVDTEEGERMSAKHYVVKMAAKCTFMAPVKDILMAGGAKILDVACGPGDWVLEMARDFPMSSFTGIDIIPEFLPESPPENVDFRVVNALQGLPFQDETFDFIYQKECMAVWTRDQWKFILSEMYRVLKPGGYIELWDVDALTLNPGPETLRLEGAFICALTGRDIDPHIAVNLKELLVDIGMRNVKSTLLPMSFAWDGPIGKLFQAVQLPSPLAIKPWLKVLLGVDSDEFDRIVEQTENEFDIHKSYVNYYIAYGMKRRKPATLIIA